MNKDTSAGDNSEECDPFDPFPEPVTIPITDVFDLTHPTARREVGS